MEYVYTALLLSESGEEINEENVTAVLETAGVAVSDSRVKALVAALEDVDVEEAIEAAAAAPAAGAAGGSGGASEAADDDEAADHEEEAADDDEAADEDEAADDDDDEDASGEGLGELFG